MFSSLNVAVGGSVHDKDASMDPVVKGDYMVAFARRRPIYGQLLPARLRRERGAAPCKRCRMKLQRFSKQRSRDESTVEFCAEMERRLCLIC